MAYQQLSLDQVEVAATGFKDRRESRLIARETCKRGDRVRLEYVNKKAVESGGYRPPTISTAFFLFAQPQP